MRIKNVIAQNKKSALTNYLKLQKVKTNEEEACTS